MGVAALGGGNPAVRTQLGDPDLGPGEQSLSHFRRVRWGFLARRARLAAIGQSPRAGTLASSQSGKRRISWQTRAFLWTPT